MTRAEWVEGGQHVRWRVERSAWALADWLNEGREWDEDYVLSASITGYSKVHLRQVARTGLAFPIWMRSASLAFTTYLHLLREPDDDARAALLAKAIKERWTPDDARKYFSDRNGFREHWPERERAFPAFHAHKKHQCPECGSVFLCKTNRYNPAGEPERTEDAVQTVGREGGEGSEYSETPAAVRAGVSSEYSDAD